MSLVQHPLTTTGVTTAVVRQPWMPSTEGNPISVGVPSRRVMPVAPYSTFYLQSSAPQQQYVAQLQPNGYTSFVVTR